MVERINELSRAKRGGCPFVFRPFPMHQNHENFLTFLQAIPLGVDTGVKPMPINVDTGMRPFFLSCQ